MGASKRIRRKLTLNVSEPRPANPLDDNTPGLRFAEGWGIWTIHGTFDGGPARCGNDPIKVAGFLAAQAAYNAHHYATNWIEVRS